MSRVKTIILIAMTCIACITVGLAIGVSVSQPTAVETVAMVNDSTPAVTVTPSNDIYFVIDNKISAEEPIMNNEVPAVEREPIKYSYTTSLDYSNQAYSNKEIYYVGDKLTGLRSLDGSMDGYTRNYVQRSTVGKVVYEIYCQYKKVASGYAGMLKIDGDMYVDDADEFKFDIYEDNNVITRYWFSVVIQADPFSFVIYDALNKRTVYGDSNFYIDGIIIDE